MNTNFSQNTKHWFLILSIALVGNIIYSQPTSFTIAGCSAAADGSYVQSADMIGGCPCYSKVGATFNIHKASTTLWILSDELCSEKVQNNVSPLFLVGIDPCNILTATANACDPSSILLNSVPTMGEWGLIILTLLLFLVGTVAIIQNKLRPRIDQFR